MSKSKTLSFVDIESLIGEKKALILCSKFGGRIIPSAKRVLADKRLAAMRYDWENNGASPRILSLKFHVSYNYACRCVNQWHKEKKQRLARLKSLEDSTTNINML